MTFLPVVERELLTAARKRSTFWLRVVAAAVSVVLGTIVLLLQVAGGAATSMLGQIVFGALTWPALLGASAAGLFLTSDSLSEEKREGTLGFLFLTDLKGYDIVGGKLLASSLRAFYALLALLPILAVTMLIGGVTGEVFWKTALALVNALLFSLVVGMLVSALSRDSQKALSGTLLLLLAFNLGGPLIDSLMAGVRNRGFMPNASLTSPGFLFVSAGRWRPDYWRGLLINQAIIWCCLALTSVMLPRTWQQRTKAVAVSGSYSRRYGSVNRRRRLRERWLGTNPMIWLSCRERWQSAGIWLVALLSLGTFIVSRLFYKSSPMIFIWSYVAWIYTFVFYLWAASQSGRFFFEIRRSGLMELLMSTPLSEREIVQGRWRAFRRIFALPLAIYLSVAAFGTALSYMVFSTGAAGAAAGGSSRFAMPAFMFISAAAGVVITAANLAAICWFGMWMGMISRSGNIATLRTLAFVQILPAFMISFASMAITMSILRFGVPVWFPALNSIIGAMLALSKDAAFIVWSRKKLFYSIRAQAGVPIGQVRLKAAAVPPVIAQAGPAPGIPGN